VGLTASVARTDVARICEGLEGNFGRWTGYHNFVAAVADVAGVA